MILYMDTSALVKRYVMEPGSREVITLMEQSDVIGSSLLTRVEMASALGESARLNWVDAKGAANAWQDFLSHWLSIVRISVTTVLIERASRLAWDYGLRGYDATHFAAALIWQESLDMPVTLVTYDRELWLAAKKAEMAVWPEGLDL
jgi:predicted nucleic acid-binding protein